MAFLQSWSDEKGLQNLNLAIVLIMFAISFYVFNNVPGLAQIGLVFIVMSIITFIAIANDRLSDSSKVLEFISFGKDIPTALMGLIGGIGIGFLIYSLPKSITSLFTIATPLALSTASNLPVINIFGILFPTTFVVVVMLAPIIEEAFFRQTLFPTIARITGNPVLGIALASIFFGLMHYLVYSGNIALLTSAIIFSVVVLILGFTFKTATIGIGLHLMNNATAYFGSPSIGLILIAVFIGLWWISRKK